jgi:hypothetical protein
MGAKINFFSIYPQQNRRFEMNKCDCFTIWGFVPEYYPLYEELPASGFGLPAYLKSEDKKEIVFPIFQYFAETKIDGVAFLLLYSTI